MGFHSLFIMAISSTQAWAQLDFNYGKKTDKTVLRSEVSTKNLSIYLLSCITRTEDTDLDLRLHLDSHTVTIHTNA